MERITGWLRRLLNARSADEMAGITISPPCWEVPGRRLDASAFFRALSHLVPEGAFLVLEGGSHPGELRALLEDHAVPGEARVALGTIWPRERVFHLPATSALLAALAQVSDHSAEPEVCSHLYVYEGDTVLLYWHDAFSNPFYLSKRLAAGTVESFCQELGVQFRDLDDTE